MNASLKHVVPAILTASLAVVVATPLQADTIVAGDDYVGDFADVTINNSSVVNANDLPGVADTGWEGSTPRWTVSNQTLVRQSSANGFQDAGVGIAFDAPDFEQGTLTFDYDATGATTSNSGLPNLVLYAIDDVNPLASDNNEGVSLNEQNFDSINSSSDEGASAEIITPRYTYRLIGEWKLTNTSGSFDSGTLDLVPDGSTNVTGHIFAIRSSAGAGDVTIDNVTLVPEAINPGGITCSRFRLRSSVMPTI